jgi:hypothetical protein
LGMIFIDSFSFFKKRWYMENIYKIVSCGIIRNIYRGEKYVK